MATRVILRPCKGAADHELSGVREVRTLGRRWRFEGKGSAQVVRGFSSPPGRSPGGFGRWAKAEGVRTPSFFAKLKLSRFP